MKPEDLLDGRQMVKKKKVRKGGRKEGRNKMILKWIILEGLEYSYIAISQ